MKRLFSLLAVVMMVWTCGGEEDNSDSDNEKPDQTDTTSAEVVDEPLIIDISLNKITEFPKECKIKGKTVDAYSWNDQNGTNYFIRTMGDLQTDTGDEDWAEYHSQYLYAFHYVEKNGKFKLLKETTDYIKECEFDLIMNHELDAITLTDIDEDEIGEIAFIYRLTCTSDVSPSTQKLIMLENGEKYPLRGTTRVMGDGGDYEVGEEFKNASKGFLEHARKLWSEHLTEYDFDL